MSWHYVGKNYEIDIPQEKQRFLVDALLSTSESGQYAVELFGMPGYLFPDRDEYIGGRVVVKTWSMVANPRGVEFSYHFSGDRLHLSDIRSWDDSNTEALVRELLGTVRSAISSI